MRPHSRGANRPSDASTWRPEAKRGRRECRVLAAPASLACKKAALYARKQRQGSRTSRHSLRDGLRLIRDLLGVPCSLATIALRYVPQDLIPASGDQDHTISLVRSRIARLATRSRPPPPAPTFRDDREAPLSWRGMWGLSIVFRKTEEKYFCKGGLTQIRKIGASGKSVAGIRQGSRTQPRPFTARVRRRSARNHRRHRAGGNRAPLRLRRRSSHRSSAMQGARPCPRLHRRAQFAVPRPVSR